MAVSLSITPASGSITAKTSVCKITVDDADKTVRQRIKVELDGQRDLVSEEFQPNDDGQWVWNSLMFPAAGEWTATLYETGDDSTVTTLAITVS